MNVALSNAIANRQKLGTLEKEKELSELGDRSEVGELRNRMKVLMNKLATSKKEKDILERENQGLQQEIMQMQSHLRCMVSGFANTSCAFPMTNELSNQIAEFYKCECFDIFFDVLCPELNMKGILFFFQSSVTLIQKLILEYFNPAFQNIQQVGCFESIDGPIMNVLRKSFQSNYKQIQGKVGVRLPQIRDDIQKHLKLGNEDTNLQLLQFLEKLFDILFNCFISDPPLTWERESIGSKVYFSQTKHDPIDGFIKPKEECYVLLPQVLKGQEQMTKALVVSANYQLDNL